MLIADLLIIISVILLIFTLSIIKAVDPIIFVVVFIVTAVIVLLHDTINVGRYEKLLKDRETIHMELSEVNNPIFTETITNKLDRLNNKIKYYEEHLSVNEIQLYNKNKEVKYDH